MSLWASLGHDIGGASNSVSSTVGSSSSIWWLRDLQYIDKLLMCLWSCSDWGCCFQVAYGGCGRSPYISHVLLACLHLDSGLVSSSLYLAGTSRGVLRQSVAFRSISHIIYVMFLPAQFALGNLGALSRPLRWLYSFWAMPGWTVDLLVAFGRIFGIFLCEKELGSCGRFTSCSSRYFRVLQHGEVRTVDASLHLESGHSVHEPPAFDSHFDRCFRIA